MTQLVLMEELTPSEANLIVESSQDQKSMWLKGLFMQAGSRNRNGRIYSNQEMTEQVNNFNQRAKASNGILGELDHPPTLSIALDRVSHVITELWMVGNDAYGKAKLLNTPMGKIAQELVNAGVKIGVSSRGAGNLSESGDVSGFVLTTIDIVATPSCEPATPASIYESLDSKQGTKVITLAEHIQHDQDAQKYLKTEILKWISSDLFKK